jgi:hypothetical protein
MQLENTPRRLPVKRPQGVLDPRERQKQLKKADSLQVGRLAQVGRILKGRQTK